MKKEKILKLFNKGYSYNEIAKELGCSKGTISYYCKSLPNPRKTKEFSKEKIQKVRIYYKNNTLRETANFFKSSTSTIWKYVSNIKKPLSNTLFSIEKDTSILELRNYLKEKDKEHQLGIYIRNKCRRWLKYLQKRPCKNCGYNLHVDLCHVKAIKDFDDKYTLGEINNESNVIPLCKNCHWEFDNNLLKIKL